MGTRRKAREMALQSLYQFELSGIPASQTLEALCSHFDVPRKALPYARSIVDGVLANWDRIDNLIQKHAANWRMNRMAPVDRNIMRIAVYEFCIGKEVPASIAINEAIEITKRYSTDEAGSFVNGILDAIRDNEISGIEV